MPSKPRRDNRNGRSRSSFSRETNLARRHDTREQRRSVLVVTNGESTEKDYFEAPTVTTAPNVRRSPGTRLGREVFGHKVTAQLRSPATEDALN
jgi:hypothetical protein